MVVYDLECRNSHVFEGWFKNLDSFKAQKRAGLVACPACGSTKVEVRLSGGHIVKRPSPIKTEQGKKETKTAVEVQDKTQELAANIDVSILVKSLNHFIKKNFDNVGKSFPEEARKIYYGESEQRNIYGEATPEEKQKLSEEGVPFAVIPETPKNLDN